MDMNKVLTVEELTQENQELREMMEHQERKLERAIFAIYQLHGGLYNSNTQSDILAKRNALLFGRPFPMPPPKEEADRENPSVTTRQGDNHELRIQQLEQTIKNLEEKVNSIYKRNTLRATH